MARDAVHYFVLIAAMRFKLTLCKYYYEWTNELYEQTNKFATFRDSTCKCFGDAVFQIKNSHC